jgi:hypothetical protein
MSITATEAARVLSTWTDSARPPMVANHGDWKRPYRPLTAGEIQRGRRYLERESLHRAAREAHTAAVVAEYERKCEREMRDERVARDSMRRALAAGSCALVIAARARAAVVREAQADLHEALGCTAMANALRSLNG